MLLCQSRLYTALYCVLASASQTRLAPILTHGSGRPMLTVCDILKGLGIYINEIETEPLYRDIICTLLLVVTSRDQKYFSKCTVQTKCYMSKVFFYSVNELNRITTVATVQSKPVEQYSTDEIHTRKHIIMVEETKRDNYNTLPYYVLHAD